MSAETVYSTQRVIKQVKHYISMVTSKESEDLERTSIRHIAIFEMRRELDILEYSLRQDIQMLSYDKYAEYLDNTSSHIVV